MKPGGRKWGANNIGYEKVVLSIVIEHDAHEEIVTAGR